MNQQSIEQIIESERRLRLILENTTEGWWEWNVATNDTYLSPRWFKMLGYDPTTYSSSFDLWKSLLHEEDRDKAISLLYTHLEKDDKWELPFRMRTNVGDYIWISSRSRVVERDEHGNALKVVGFHLDITKEKQLEEAKKEQEIKEELIAGIIRVSHSSFKVYDFTSKKFVYTAGGIYKQLGYTQQEFQALCQNFIENLVHPQDVILFKDYIDGLKNDTGKAVHEVVFRVKAKMGTYHWIASRDTIFRRDGQHRPSQIIGSVIDISARKDLEEKLEGHISYLEKLSYQNSHELRGPLATLLGLLNLIETNAEVLDNDKTLEYLRRSALQLDEVIHRFNQEIGKYSQNS